MLFQRLYNWIKYKTLPPSFLFKNRLFIERDSKHKRILNNFGLIFRSSKWSSYETYNIKINFKNQYYYYFLFLFLSLVLFLFLSLNSFYYLQSQVLNYLSFFFWVNLDSFDYYISFFIWSFYIFFYNFLNLIYSFFFFNNFSLNFSFKKKQNLNAKKEIFLSKQDLNWVLYSWLTNNNSNSSFDLKNFYLIEKLFDSEINKKWWNNNYDFFIKLYKLNYFFNLLSLNSNVFFLKNKINNVKNASIFKNNNDLLFYLNNSSYLYLYNKFIFWHCLSNYKNYFYYKNSKNQTNRFEWNLYNFNNEIENYKYLLFFKNGFFYFDNFNQLILNFFSFNFFEFFNFNALIENQNKAAKWNRWLYRYSILHRKILKNSHKLTLTKKLINSGFYSNELFSKNLWNSEHLSRYVDKKNLFSSFFNLYYENFFFSKNNINAHSFKLISVSNNFNQTNSLNFLNFYENSYFWFLKRFYFFNTIFNNNIKSKLIYNGNSSLNFFYQQQNQSTTNYFLLVSYLLKSTTFTLPFFSLNSDYSKNDIFFVNNRSSFFLNDLYINMQDLDVFNKDTLQVLISLTSAPLYNNKNRFFFNYLTLNSFFNINKKSLFFYNNLKNNNKFKNHSKNINFLLLFSLINNENIFLNDLKYYSLFY